MNQKNETDAFLPEWLAEYTAAIEQPSRSEAGLAGLDEILEDYALLTKAIRYWSGKSAQKVEEFRYLAKELEREISAKLSS